MEQDAKLLTPLITCDKCKSKISSFVIRNARSGWVTVFNEDTGDHIGTLCPKCIPGFCRVCNRRYIVADMDRNAWFLGMDKTKGIYMLCPQHKTLIKKK